MVLKRFNKLDRRLTEETTNPRDRKASRRFDRNMFKAGKHYVHTIRDGHEDLPRFNYEHKKDNQKLYDTAIDDLQTAA